jgi:hypothetical protein
MTDRELPRRLVLDAASFTACSGFATSIHTQPQLNYYAFPPRKQRALAANDSNFASQGIRIFGTRATQVDYIARIGTHSSVAQEIEHIASELFIDTPIHVVKLTV